MFYIFIVEELSVILLIALWRLHVMYMKQMVPKRIRKTSDSYDITKTIRPVNTRKNRGHWDNKKRRIT